MYDGEREIKRMGYEAYTTRTMFDQGLSEINDKSSMSHLMGMHYLYYSRDWLIVTLLGSAKEKKITREWMRGVLLWEQIYPTRA